MKKRSMIPAAIAALMGVGAYFGHATATPADTSDLLLDNAEALAQGEATIPGEATIVCDGPVTKGHCWMPNNGLDKFVRPCIASGSRLDYCA